MFIYLRSGLSWKECFCRRVPVQVSKLPGNPVSANLLFCVFSVFFAAPISHPIGLRAVLYEFANLSFFLERIAFRVLLHVHNELKTKCPRCRAANPGIAFFRLRKATVADD